MHPAGVAYPAGPARTTSPHGRWRPLAHVPAHAKAVQQHYGNGARICTHLLHVLGALVARAGVLVWWCERMLAHLCSAGLWSAGRRPKICSQTEHSRIAHQAAHEHSGTNHAPKHHGMMVIHHHTSMVWCMSGLVMCTCTWRSVTATVLPTNDADFQPDGSQSPLHFRRPENFTQHQKSTKNNVVVFYPVSG